MDEKRATTTEPCGCVVMSMKTDGNKSKNSRCGKCQLAIIKVLVERIDSLERLVQRYSKALHEADRRNVAMERSGLSVQKRIH
jgi:hypothetical protein